MFIQGSGRCHGKGFVCIYCTAGVSCEGQIGGEEYSFPYSNETSVNKFVCLVNTYVHIMKDCIHGMLTSVLSC